MPAAEPAPSLKLARHTDHLYIVFLIPGCSAMEVWPCRFIYNHLPNTGLVPVRLNRRRGTFSAMKSYTVGAMADSYYEYLLKMWLLKGQQVCDLHRTCVAMTSAQRALPVLVDVLINVCGPAVNTGACRCVRLGLVLHDIKLLKGPQVTPAWNGERSLRKPSCQCQQGS